MPTALLRGGRVVQRIKHVLLAVGLVAVGVWLPVSEPTAGAQSTQAAITASPIKHVVVIFQENHSFDNALGKLCVVDHRCDGAVTGKLLNGSTPALTQASDIIPDVAHSTKAQTQAVDNGKMDGWEKVAGCTARLHYQCLSQFDPSQIPNLSSLARQYAISDRTFETDRILSFGAHVELAAANLDGFGGNIPSHAKYAIQKGTGWGCNSYTVTPWRLTPTDPYQDVPACIPYPDGTGSWWDSGGPAGVPQLSPVRHVNNIFDSLDAGARTWKVYNRIPAFDICSYFATCAHSVQSTNVVRSGNVIADAQNGALADVNFVLPNTTSTSGSADQHNGHSMAVGDNWIGSVVSAIQNGPDWPSTAIFITYDDCGCFYDHVPPPTSRLGIRLPMVIVSPYAKPGYTDSTNVSFVGMLAFTEHVFGLPALSGDDANSYDYMAAFDFTAPPRLAKTPLTGTTIPASTLKIVRSLKIDLDDPDDTT
jgi:phospholipase C